MATDKRIQRRLSIVLARIRELGEEANALYRKLAPENAVEVPCRFGGPHATSQCTSPATVEVMDANGERACFCALHATRFRNHPLFAVCDL